MLALIKKNEQNIGANEKNIGANQPLLLNVFFKKKTNDLLLYTEDVRAYVCCERGIKCKNRQMRLIICSCTQRTYVPMCAANNVQNIKTDK